MTKQNTLRHQSIKDYPIQIRITNKKGRPTNFELEASKAISKEMDKPETKKQIEDARLDLFTFGTCII